jgi:hypothetical protein
VARGIADGGTPYGPAKRGRKQGLPDPGAGPVAAFAHALGTLKVAAGDPSYERMCTELGAVASKSALSAAARGRDLPSWETSWEFVRCLAAPGTDTDELRLHWRARWEAAQAAMPPAIPAEPCAVAAVPPPVPAVPPPVPTPSQVRSGWRRENRLLIVGLVIGAGVGGLMWLLIAAASPPAPPIAGDEATFVRDVTVPDGSTVRAGERFVKVWELRNSGTVAWRGRYLMRLPGKDGEPCRTPDRVPVPATEPGSTAQVSVVVDGPIRPTRCKVYWKLVDEQGRPYFPLTRPMFFDVVVAG